MGFVLDLVHSENLISPGRPRPGGGGGGGGYGFHNAYWPFYWVCAARETPIFSPEFPFRSSGISRFFFSVGGHGGGGGGLGFSKGGTKILSWQAPHPPPPTPRQKKKSSPKKGPHFPAEQADKQAKKNKM